MTYEHERQERAENALADAIEAGGEDRPLIIKEISARSDQSSSRLRYALQWAEERGWIQHEEFWTKHLRRYCYRVTGQGMREAAIWHFHSVLGSRDEAIRELERYEAA